MRSALRSACGTRPSRYATATAAVAARRALFPFCATTHALRIACGACAARTTRRGFNRGARRVLACHGMPHAGRDSTIALTRAPLLRGAHAWPARAPSRAVHPTWVPFVLTWGPFGGPGLYFEIAPAREPFRVIFWRMAGAGTFFHGLPATQTPGGGAVHHAL